MSVLFAEVCLEWRPTIIYWILNLSLSIQTTDRHLEKTMVMHNDHANDRPAQRQIILEWGADANCLCELLYLTSRNPKQSSKKATCKITIAKYSCGYLRAYLCLTEAHDGERSSKKW